ncbi:endolytic transglycosylase MltG [Helicobacter fennelliae]
MIKRIIKILSLLLDTALLIVLIVFFYLALEIKTTPIVSIPSGSISSIITYLSKNNFDINQIDKNILRILGKPQSGLIDMGGERIAKGDFLYRLVNAKAAQNKIVLIPGETLYFFIQDIAVKLSLDENKLKESYSKYAPYEDGVIFPNTYKIPIGINEESLMMNLVQQSLKIHQNLAVKLLGSYKQEEWFRYITIASIIQKEAANKQEMPLVSAVIFNRLKLRMPLQMDGSLNYGAYSHTKITPQRIRTDPTPFNTYRNKGIPPYPVGSASIEAIRAAVNPADVDYLYFVRNKNGVHTFSTTYKEHLDNIHFP